MIFFQLKTFITTQLVMGWPIRSDQVEVGVFSYALNAFAQLSDFDVKDVNELVSDIKSNVFHLDHTPPRISRFTFFFFLFTLHAPGSLCLRLRSSFNFSSLLSTSILFHGSVLWCKPPCLRQRGIHVSQNVLYFGVN